MTKTIFIVGGDPLVVKMFKDAGWEAHAEHSHGLIPDLVCFTGGEDVSPYLYGEENISSSCNPIRDEFEREVYEEFLEREIPMVGICRGGQFLNVMNGGKMIQHIGPFSGYTDCQDYDGNHFVVHVDHHQGIVRVPETSYSILAMDIGDHPVFGPGVGLTYACLYIDTKSLCFQPHPEWGHEPTRQLFFELIEQYLGIV